MPHFGLMDPEKLNPAEAALQRCRLHLRSGKRRIRQGKISAGVATLYDAFIHAMKWYLLAHPQVNSGQTAIDMDRDDEDILFDCLVRSGVITTPFDFQTFNRLMHESLENRLMEGEYRGLIAAIERVMVELEVMPFDEDTLPPEDSRTF